MALQLINSKGEPGLLFPFVPHSIETGVMQDEEGGIFLGIAQLTTINDAYFEGDMVNVVKKGRIQVKVSAEVLANQAAYVDDEGNFSATETGTAIAGGVFKTNSAANGIAELEIA